MNARIILALLSASLLCTEISAQPTQSLPQLPETRSQQLKRIAPLLKRENIAPNVRRAAQMIMTDLALQAELLAASGQRAEAAERYAEIARLSDDPAVAQRAAEIAASADNLLLAREMAGRWAELDSSSTKARDISAALAIAQGDITRALDGIVTSLPKEREARGQAIVDLARSLARSRDRTQSLSLMRALAEREKTAQAWMGAAIAEFVATLPTQKEEDAKIKQDVSGALAAVTRALAIDGSYAPAAAFRGELMLREDPKAALAFVAAHLEKFPNGKETRAFYAQTLAQSQQFERARDQYKMIVATGDTKTQTEARAALAIVYLRLKDPQAALAELDLIDGSEHINRNVWLLYRGQALERLERYAEAIAAWEQVAENAPQTKDARSRSANAMAKLGKISEARAYLEEHFDDENDEALAITIVQTHAGWLRESKRFDDALVVLDQGLAKFPDSSELLYESAMVEDRLKRFDRMESKLRRVIAQKPDGAGAMNALAFSFAERNVSISEARALIDRAIALSPDDPAIMDSVGWVYFREGKLVESEQWLRRAYEKFPDGEVAAHLAEVLVAANRRDEAKRLLDAHNPNDANLQHVRDALKRLFAQ